MVNMKEDIIKEAYGKYYDELSDHIDENGFTSKYWLLEYKEKGKWHMAFDLDWIKKEDVNYCRPISLRGLEDNRGWIKIESESDLPKEGIYCYFILKGEHNKGYKEYGYWDNTDGIFADYKDENYLRYFPSEVSHWILALEPELPLY